MRKEGPTITKAGSDVLSKIGTNTLAEFGLHPAINQSRYCFRLKSGRQPISLPPN